MMKFSILIGTFRRQCVENLEIRHNRDLIEPLKIKEKENRREKNAKVAITKPVFHEWLSEIVLKPMNIHENNGFHYAFQHFQNILNSGI